ncbi:hypothetical protein BH24DEI2_BH24DEI2_03810 [soil metagenome]
MVPGEYFVGEGEIELNSGRDTRTLRVDNSGDRPVQVGSHTHFFEVNRALLFDRAAAYGFRLNVPAGTALRFEPGEGRAVELVAYGGDRIVYGMNALVNGGLEPQKATALAAAKEHGYRGNPK